MSKEMKYEAAYAELQAIVRKMENDELLIHSSQKLSFHHFYPLFCCIFTI